MSIEGHVYYKCSLFCRFYIPRPGGGRGGEGAPRRGGMGRRGPPPTQGGAQGDEGQEVAGGPPQRRYNLIKFNC